MKYGSVCSGIEAATVAWHPLGWVPVWFSEIERFPSTVLKYHYPHVPNLGDMTKLSVHEIYQKSALDLLVGGTPCQSFSIAGLRGGLADQRGNLALEYCRILIAKQPRWFVWENVPGVFSAFSDEEESKIYTDAGASEGTRQSGLFADDGGGDGESGDGRVPTDFGDIRGYDCTQTADFATLLTAFRECGYSCAYRVFDSQYFGVPQRRRRVFVVGYLGDDWRPPTAVLFERDSMRRDFTPSRETGQRVAGALNARSKGRGITGGDEAAADNDQKR